jgi:WD40 repeat protein
MTDERGLGRPFAFDDESTRDPSIFVNGYEGHPVEFRPDGRLFAVGLNRQGIALRDARELTPVGAPMLETGGEVKELSFSPDGRSLAAWSLDEVVTLWDVASRFRLLHKRVDASWGIEFSPDGRLLATTSGPRVRLFDAETGATLGEIRAGADAGTTTLPLGRPVGWLSPTFSEDGTMIATTRGFEGGADVWDVGTGSSIATVDALPEPDPLDSAVALSPDGRTLAVGGWYPGIVRLVDVRTGKLLHELDTGGAGAFTLEFTPDGRTLAVSGFESVAFLWDVATGTQIGPRLTAGSRRTSLDLSPDGRRLLMAASNGEGAVWNIDPERWKQRACAIANRALTRQEWDEFLPSRPYDPACATEPRS